MKVYTLEMGVYSDRSLVGIFRTLEAAKEAAIPKSGTFYRGRINGPDSPVSEMEWIEASWTLFGGHEQEWVNNGQSDDSAHICRWELP
jgi:hypothetical protein